MLEVKEMYEPLKFAAQSLTFMKLVYKKKSAERMNKKKKKKKSGTTMCFQARLSAAT